MRIIPAIDIINGQCVRLTKGNYTTKKVYSQNPVEVAKTFEAAGIEYLHLVDLDGAKANHIVNYKVLESITHQTNLKVDFGGGLKSDQDLKIAFECGANQVTGGSIAVKRPQVFEQWLQTYGAEKIILGADCRDQKIAISGWQETSNIDLLSFIRAYQEKGIAYVICTDISKDGMLQGPSFDLYKSILEDNTSENKRQPLQLIASGGISSMGDLQRLRAVGCEGAIIGKALYEGKISLNALEKFNSNN